MKDAHGYELSVGETVRFTTQSGAEVHGEITAIDQTFWPVSRGRGTVSLRAADGREYHTQDSERLVAFCLLPRHRRDLLLVGA
jgi:hypothetical protein